MRFSSLATISALMTLAYAKTGVILYADSVPAGVTNCQNGVALPANWALVSPDVFTAESTCGKQAVISFDGKTQAVTVVGPAPEVLGITGDNLLINKDAYVGLFGNSQFVPGVTWNLA